MARFPDLPKTFFRPAIVESAVAFPTPGWNEGLNTSGPLAYFVGTWFRHLPARKDKPVMAGPGFGEGGFGSVRGGEAV